MIGKVIQQKRKEAGLTQAQMAERLGVTAPAVNRWEKDLSYPDISLLAPLARLLQTDLNELFSFYESLSHKEREIIVNRARDLFLRETDTEGIEFIENAIQQNLSDGLLYKQVADMLYGIHTIKQSLHPAIYLERIAQYYERAMELLPTEAEDISYSLVSIYANLSEYSKAEAAWNRLPESKYDKAWAHAEMLCAMQSYKTAIPEIKNIVLRQIISLSDKLNYLKDILSLTGDKDAAQLAETKAAELRDVFDLWEGFDKMSQLTSAIVCSDTDAEINHLTDFLRLNTVNKQISGCPLFSDVTLGKTSEKCKTSADLMAEILRSLQKRTN